MDRAKATESSLRQAALCGAGDLCLQGSNVSARFMRRDRVPRLSARLWIVRLEKTGRINGAFERGSDGKAFCQCSGALSLKQSTGLFSDRSPFETWSFSVLPKVTSSNSLFLRFLVLPSSATGGGRTRHLQVRQPDYLAPATCVCGG